MSSRPDPAAAGPGVGRRRFARGLALAAFGLTALSGCGFRPMYGAASGADEQLAAIDVGVISERSGQILRNNLIRMLNPSGRPVNPEYRLSVTLTEQQQNLAVQDGRTGTRRNLILVAAYTLTRLDDGSTRTSGQSRTITSFNRQRDEFATLSAERAARERALYQVGQDLRMRLAIHFAEEAAAPAVGFQPGAGDDGFATP